MIQLIMLVGLILPWLSLIFMDRVSIKRFFPVAIFTSLIMTIIFEIAYTYNWWDIHKKIVPWGTITDVTFAYGLFAIGTMWIFYFTYHRFRIYVITNLIFDALMAYGGLWILDVLGIATLRNISSTQYFLVMFLVSFLIYGYQRWQEKIFIKQAKQLPKK